MVDITTTANHVANITLAKNNMVQHNIRQQLVLWIIWALLVCGIVIYPFALGGGVPIGPNAETAGVNFAVVLAVGQIIIASVVRWLLIPRTKTAGQLLVLMIIGLALSEAVEFYGLFLVPTDQPSTKLGLWVLTILSGIQFIPLYATSKEKAEI